MLLFLECVIQCLSLNWTEKKVVEEVEKLISIDLAEKWEDFGRKLEKYFADYQSGSTRKKQNTIQSIENLREIAWERKSNRF